ncbi:unnamed protein product [Urochloa humidicola]
MSFRTDHTEDEDPATRRCASFGEAASAVPSDPLTEENLANWFKGFYRGFTEDVVIWFAYEDDPRNFELPFNFNFEEVMTDDTSREILVAAITPTILPSGIHPGRSNVPTYEFYHPAIAAHQLGFSQLLIRAILTEIVKPRNRFGSGLEYSRLKDRLPDAGSINLDSWTLASFTMEPYLSRWSELSFHIFFVLARIYCLRICSEYVDSEGEAEKDFPETSRSGRAIDYAPPTDHPYLGRNAPSVQDIADGCTHKRKATNEPPKKKTTKRKSRTASPPIDVDLSAPASSAVIIPSSSTARPEES